MLNEDLEYYLRPMSEEALLKKQEEEVKSIMYMHYHTMVGIAIKKEWIADCIDEIKNAENQYVFQGEPISKLFATIICIYLPYELSDCFNHYRVKFQIEATTIIKDDPIHALINF